MTHCATVDPPIANWPILYSVRHQISMLLDEHENHLKPELAPTIITNRRAFIQTDDSLLLRWVSEYAFVEHKLKSATFSQTQHIFKHVFYVLLLADQQVLKGIHLHFVPSKKDGI